MNLGDIYFKTFIVLLVAPPLVTFALLGLLRQRLKLTWGGVLMVVTFIAPFAGLLLNTSYHRPLFVWWHRTQNRYVPPAGCVTYAADFSRLYATYELTLPQFDAWVAAHPWGLEPGSDGLLFHDAQAMGFDSADGGVLKAATHWFRPSKSN